MRNLAIFLLVALMAVSAVMVASHNTANSNAINGRDYKSSHVNDSEIVDGVDGDNTDAIIEAIAIQLQKIANELVDSMLSEGSLTLNANGDIEYNQDFIGGRNRFSISRGGVWFDRYEVEAAMGAMAMNTSAITAILYSIPPLVILAVGWIPVFGQMIAVSITGYIYGNIGIIVGGFVDAALNQKGVEIYFTTGWNWFVPWVGFGYRV